MSRTVYVNGQWLPEDQATISIFDRGFLMADGVYEVTSVLDGKLVDFPGHVTRLTRSLTELEMTPPATAEGLLALHRQIVTANGLVNGRVYLQVTRGNSGDRDFLFPDPETTPPTLVMFTQATSAPEDSADAKRGIKVISIPDIRWQRRDIKTVQLLYPSMGKMMAKAAGADDAWLVEEGLVTEGTSNNAWIVKDGRIITRGLSNEILHGITRASLMAFAADAQIEVEERSFTLAEAMAADEAFVTSASAFVMPVVEIDGVMIGGGQPGRIASRLREIYIDESRKAAI